MKKTTLLILITVLILLLSGCSSSGKDVSKKNYIDQVLDMTQSPTETIGHISVTESADKQTAGSEKEDQAEIQNAISLYCEHFLTYTDSPLNNIEMIKAIVTDDYYQGVKDIMGYISESEDSYSQAVAVDKFYYDSNPKETDELEVACLCYQNMIVNNNSSTINTFYIFNFIKDPDRGWIINSVDNYRDLIGG